MDEVAEGAPRHPFLAAIFAEKNGEDVQTFFPVGAKHFVVWIYATIFFPRL